MPAIDPRGIRPKSRGRVDVTSGGVIVPITGGTTSGGGGAATPADPGTFPYHLALVEIQFDTGWEYFSFEGVGTPSQFYEPYVMSIGSLEREAPVWGGNFRVGDVDITFINYDQYFTIKKGGSAPGKYFYNRTVRILYGDSGLAAMTVLFTGRIQKWRISENGIFTITARDASYDKFNTHIHETLKTTTPDVFPNMPVGVEPRLVPVVYGSCDIDPAVDLSDYDLGGPIPCYLVDENASGRWRYVVAQHVCKSVTNVFRYGQSLNQASTPGTYFSLEEASGDRVSEDGTVTLADFNTVTSTTGKVGTAALFAAASLEYLAVNNPPAYILPTSSFTGHAWVYLADKSADRTIAAQYGSLTSTRSWTTQYTNSSDRFEFFINDANGNQTSVAANTFGSPSINTWYLVMWWWDATNRLIYISVNNGAADQATTFVSGGYISPGIVTESFRLGVRNTSAGAYWDGRIDEFGWWREVLSPAERDAIYNSGSGRTYDALLPFMTFDPPPDVEWTAVATPANDQFNSICWANGLGLFVAVSGATLGTGATVIVSEDGINWDAYPSSSSSDWRAVCWSEELGLLVAVGAGTGAYVMTSPDGQTWTTRTAAANVGWNDVCWSPELGKFIAVAESGTAAQRVMESTDGITWTSRTAAASNSWAGVAWSPELSLFVAIAYSGSGNRVMTSPTGVTWTIRSSPADNTWTKVCWSSDLLLFVAVAASGSGNRVMTSSDGISWALRTSAADNNWMGVTWAPGPGLFIAVGRNGVGNNSMISEDGLTWTAVPTPGDGGYLSIAWAPEIATMAAVNYDDSTFRAMFGRSQSYEVVTATYDGVSMTCLDFFYDPRENSQNTELEITASVQGITDDGTATGTLITNPAEVLRHFLTTYAGCAVGDLDSQAFDVAETRTAGYTCAMPIIYKDIPYSDIINKWCRSFLGSFYVNNVEQFAIFVKTLTAPVSEGITITHDNDLLHGTFQVESNDAVATTLQYDWLHNPVRDYFTAHSDLDTGESTALGGDVIGDQLELFYVRDSATALAVAQAYAELYEEGVEYISYGLSIDRVDDVDLNSIADLTHWQGTGASGYAGVVTRVYQLVTEITPTNVGIRVRAVKLA